MMSHKLPRKRHGVYALAILMLLLAGGAMIVGSHNFAIRSLALAACIVSVYLIRISNVHTRSALSAKSNQLMDSIAPKRPSPAMWTVAGALAALLGISYLLLYRDALHGYHEILPVYFFAGVAAVCALYWAYLASKTFW